MIIFAGSNDSLGEVAGDSVLQEVARRLSVVARENARGVGYVSSQEDLPYLANTDEVLIARVSGNEFALLFRIIRTMTELETIAERLQQAVSQPYRVSEHEFVLTGSFGLALYPRHGEDAETVLRNASLAVRSAKEGGRNRIVAFEASLAKGVKKQLSLEARLRAVIQEGRLEVAYQPRVCVRTGKLLSMEALARWSDEELGKVSPAEFIPVAEKHGLIDALGVHVMDCALATCLRLNERHNQGLSVSVNLSARQFAHASLVDVVEQALARRSVDPSILEIEVTENVLIDDFERSIATMRSLRALGVRIALDDFGTGYASLNYLRLLPLSTVKVDRSFVCDLRPDSGECTILEAIVRMSHGLGMEVVVEGIETPEQLDLVKEIGVDEIQGFYVSQALSESEIVQWNATWRGFGDDGALPAQTLDHHSSFGVVAQVTT